MFGDFQSERGKGSKGGMKSFSSPRKSRKIKGFMVSPDFKASYTRERCRSNPSLGGDMAKRSPGEGKGVPQIP